MRRLGLVGALVAVLGGVAWGDWDEETFQRKPNPSYTIPTPRNGARSDTVVGELRLYRIRKGDTMMDLARYYSLGYNEMVEANPGLDPWVPPVGATIVIPSQWVLPCCTYEGVVVNVPEMRLFYFRRARSDPATTTVFTYPVGLGRDDWRTPSGKFRITGKTVNPVWNIPESIRKEHIEERGDPRTSIPGGAPDNPLGKYRFELSLPMYRIHGTDIPWGVGMQVSHGCVRLYPEDIERLFPLVPVGTPGEFAYQPVKVGWQSNAVYVEVHDDIYGHTPAQYRATMDDLGQRGFSTEVDPELVLTALEDGGGMPFRVSPGGDGARLARAREWGGDGAAHPNTVQAGDD